MKGDVGIRSLDAQHYEFNEEASWENSGFSYFHVYEDVAEKVPCNIEGINTSEGVKNSGGKISLYVDVLRLFCIEGTVLANNILGYYKSNNDMFRLKLHGLRNSCCCIGATEYAQRAKEIEVDSNMGSDISWDVEDFAKDILLLIDDIRVYVDSVRFLCQAEDATKEDDREQCMILGIPRELSADLKESMRNLELEDVLKKLEVIRKKRYARDIEIHLDRIVELVNQYDFTEAIELVDKIIEPI